MENMQRPNKPENDIDFLAHELVQEVRTKKTLEVIGKRLSDNISISRTQVYEVLSKVTSFLSDQPDSIGNLIEACLPLWPNIHLTVINRLVQEGKIELANDIFAHRFSTIDFNKENQFNISIAIELAIKLDQAGSAEKMIDILFDRFNNSENELGAIIGITYIYARSGQKEKAEALWQRIFEAHPNDTSIPKKYVAYQKNINRSEEKPRLPQPSTAVSPMSVSVQSEFAADLNKAKVLARTQERYKLIPICKESLEKTNDGNVSNTWFNLCRVCAEQGDIITANNLWGIILDFLPEHASSYLRFSEKFNVLGEDSEIDDLIRRAHVLYQEHKKPINKGRKYIPLKNARTVKETILDNPIEIDGSMQTVGQWLSYAGQFASAREYAKAIEIWTAVLQKEHSVMPSITRSFVRIAYEVSSEQFIEILYSSDELIKHPNFTALCRAIAGNLSDELPVFSKAVMDKALHTLPNDAGNVFMLAHLYLKEGLYSESVQLWLPLKESHAVSCARFASDLLTKGQTELAKNLFSKVAKISPVASIMHGYEFFRNAGMSSNVLVCMAPLLPTGNEKELQKHQVYALRLFIRHSSHTTSLLKNIIKKLEDSGALAPEESYKLGITPSVHRGEEAVLNEIDKEIEEYLQKYMPSLKTGKFFSSLQQRQPLMNTGRKTSRTANSVLRLPNRLYVRESHDPKPRKKK